MSIRIPHNVVAGDVIQTVSASAPTSPVAGALWYDTASAVLKVYTGSAWVPTSGAAAPVIYGPSGEVILSGTPTGATTGPGVGQYTRRAGPEQDAHLRSGAVAGSLALVESAAGVYLAHNCAWDGTQWARTIAGAAATVVDVGPFGLTLHYKSPGPATWTTFDTNQVLQAAQLTFPDGGGMVGRVTRASGPQQDVHLRSGVAAGSYAFVEAQNNAHLANNLYWDGANWQRFDPAAAAMVAIAAAGGFSVSHVLPGANPAVLGSGLQVTLQGALEQLATPGSNPLLTGNGVLHLANNVYFDGTNWQRYNTGLPAVLVRLAGASGVDLFYAAPGANPIAWTTSYNLFDPANRPPVGVTGITNYGAGWSSYGGGAAPYSARFSRDAFGYVHLGGLVAKSSAAGAGEVILGLGAGFIPQYTLICTVATIQGPAQLRVNNNGQVAIDAAVANMHLWTSLDSIPPFYAYS